jgi:hypothetical protein
MIFRKLITDKLIEDIRDALLILDVNQLSNFKHNSDVKRILKQKDYEVEEKKSKLDALEEKKKELYENFYTNYRIPNGAQILLDKLFFLYEEAIEEIQEQQKPKIDDDLIDDVKSWMRSNKAATSWGIHDVNEICSHIKILFKQLGVEE